MGSTYALTFTTKNLKNSKFILSKYCYSYIPPKRHLILF